MLQTMPLGRGDYIYLSPLVGMPDTEYSEQSEAKGLTPLSAERMAEQEQQLRAAFASGPRLELPFIARYDVSHLCISDCRTGKCRRFVWHWLCRCSRTCSGAYLGSVRCPTTLA